MRLLDVLPVTAARNAPGVTPRSLILTCNNLRSVDQVLFNGIESPSFAVFSATQILAQVPDVLDEATITEVTVLGGVPSMTERSLIQLGLGKRISNLSGTQRLIQTFVRMLLRTAGSNIFHKTLGGGLHNHVGQNVTSRVAADVAIAISAVKRQIVAAQSAYTGIPLSERLLNAEVVGVTEDPDNASVFVTVVVTAHDRQRSAATLMS
jgi:hypothetical protein